MAHHGGRSAPGDPAAPPIAGPEPLDTKRDRLEQALEGRDSSGWPPASAGRRSSSRVSQRLRCGPPGCLDPTGSLTAAEPGFPASGHGRAARASLTPPILGGHRAAPRDPSLPCPVSRRRRHAPGRPVGGAAGPPRPSNPTEPGGLQTAALSGRSNLPPISEMSQAAAPATGLLGPRPTLRGRCDSQLRPNWPCPAGTYHFASGSWAEPCQPPSLRPAVDGRPSAPLSAENVSVSGGFNTGTWETTVAVSPGAGGPGPLPAQASRLLRVTECEGRAGPWQARGGRGKRFPSGTCKDNSSPASHSNFGAFLWAREQLSGRWLMRLRCQRFQGAPI